MKLPLVCLQLDLQTSVHDSLIVGMQIFDIVIAHQLSSYTIKHYSHNNKIENRELSVQPNNTEYKFNLLVIGKQTAHSFQ